MRTPSGFTPLRAYAWVLLLVRAFLALGLGVVVLVSGRVQAGMVNIIAVYWLLGALLTLRWARAHPGVPGEGLAYGAAVGGIVAALAVFARGYLADVLDEQRTLALLGTFSVAVGLMRISGVFRESVSQDLRRSRREAVILGIMEIALGAVLIFSTELRQVVVPIVAAWGLVGGSIMLSDSIRAYRVLRRGPVPVASATSQDPAHRLTVRTARAMPRRGRSSSAKGPAGARR